MSIVDELKGEGVERAKKVGINNTDTMLEMSRDLIKTVPFDDISSMLQEIEAKRQTEVENFAGTVCELGE